MSERKKGDAHTCEQFDEVCAERDALEAALAEAKAQAETTKGFDRLMDRLYNDRPLQPDPDYSQDVAFLVHCFVSWRKEANERWKALEERTRELNDCESENAELLKERAEDRAAIRALVHMGEVYDTATIHWGEDCECFRCDTLRKHAPAIRRALGEGKP